MDGFCQYRRYWLKEDYDHTTEITRKTLKKIFYHQYQINGKIMTQ